MASGQLSVTPVTVRGLEDIGLGGSRTFVGCYINASEKHRTRSADGPEPEWNHTLYCNVSPGNSYLQVELVNEDPGSSGVVGGARVPLFQAFNEGRAEQWVTIVGHQNEPVAQLLLHLDFKGELAGDDEEQHSRGIEQEEEEDDGVPTWVKFGGAALGAAAVVGLGVWAYHEYKENEEEEREKEEEAAAENNYYGEAGHSHHEDHDGSSSSSSSSSSSDED